MLVLRAQFYVPLVAVASVKRISKLEKSCPEVNLKSDYIKDFLRSNMATTF